MAVETDLLGLALIDFFLKKKDRPKLLIHNHYGDPDLMDPGVYFRKPAEMPKVEIFAMSLCHGKVLDVGAGVGSHVLHLQEQGFDITALEISETACDIMKKRGVVNIYNSDFFFFNKTGYDIMFCMMNGIGFSGSIEGLKRTLTHARDILKPGGVILFDSSDVSYLYPKARLKVMPYYGELDYQYQYGDKWGSWFKWLYIDQKTIKEIARSEGWNLQILFEDETGHYLGGLQRLQ